jgi:hypothetical protein
MKADWTYNGGGAGGITAADAGHLYQIDCYVDGGSYDLHGAKLDGTPCEWSEACGWPTDVISAIRVAAEEMTQEAINS